MFKRIGWFVGGAAAGAVGATAAKRKVVKVAKDLPPVRAVNNAVDTVRSAGERVADAVHSGREAMRAKEYELRARRDGREIAEVEVIDGRIVATSEVKPGQVIVIREFDGGGPSSTTTRARSLRRRSANRPRRGRRTQGAGGR